MVQVQSYFLGKWWKGVLHSSDLASEHAHKIRLLINSRAKLKPFKRCCVVVAFLLFFITYPFRH